jgi:hypothetical protein
MNRILFIVWDGTYLKPTLRVSPYLSVLYDGLLKFALQLLATGLT